MEMMEDADLDATGGILDTALRLMIEANAFWRLGLCRSIAVHSRPCG
jgi:hypothetical protein